MSSGKRWEQVSPRDFAASWLALKRGFNANPAIWPASEWVTQAELDWSEDRPDDLFEAIVVLTEERLTLWELQLLGAGPIETLLCAHFNRYIQTFVLLGLSDPSILKALLSVETNEKDAADFESALEQLRRSG